MKYNRRTKERRERHILNDKIRCNEIRLVGDDIESEIMSMSKARQISEEQELDLMLVTDKGNPPVVRLCNYQKFLYQEKKRKKDEAQKQKGNNKEMKEIRFSPNISEHDLGTKRRKVKEFIEGGHKVKLDMRFKGGRMFHNNKGVGEAILLKLAVDLEDISKADSLPKLNGRNISMIISPKK